MHFIKNHIFLSALSNNFFQNVLLTLDKKKLNLGLNTTHD